MDKASKHPYLNLNIAGEIEQYVLFIRLEDLPRYAEAGWLTYQQVGLPEGDEQASMMYGDIDFTSETLVFNQPVSLNSSGAEGLIDQTVTGWSSHEGTYGMGGPGFFRLTLNGAQNLVYAVWNASDFVLLDGRVVTASPTLYHQQRPWVSTFGDDLEWDELTPRLLGSRITAVTLSNDVLTLTLLNIDGQVASMEFVRNDHRLPRVRGRHRNAYKTGTIAEYLLLTEVGSVLVV